ncbi:hypothetical protein ACIQFU_01975 [Streptomyces sp. NPDC093065]|uniref:hypothetical protein n=1 Tax=Streptomyces sp. NPDC093065 TaxID=3366021 RepID=UPI00380CD653
MVTKYRTPVHTGYYGSSTVTKTLAAKTSVRTYYKCVNSYGNVWYEITGKMDQDTSKSRFIYSGNLMP